MSGPSEDLHDPQLAEPEYLYTVLNLPISASKEDIRERYRQLSLVFHPDKQHGSPRAATALRRFLEVQKAYEVLSDPVTRQAYDLYGLAGVRLARESLTSSSLPSEVERVLAKKKAESDWQTAHTTLRSVSDTSLGLSAHSLFAAPTDDAFYAMPLRERVQARLAGVRFTGVRVKNSVSKNVAERVVVSVAGQARVGPVGGLASAGARQVDLSARWTPKPHLILDASTSLFRARNITLGGTWDTGDSSASLKLFFAPALVSGFAQLVTTAHTPLASAPPLTLSLSRRLFPHSPLLALFEFSSNNALPTFTLALASQRRLRLLPFEEEEAPSVSGLARAAASWSVGVSVLGVLPALFVEGAVLLAELGVRLGARVEAGVQARSGVLSAVWGAAPGPGLSSLGVDVGLSNTGVFVKLNVVYMNQEFHLPVTLSAEPDASAAFWTTVLPTAAAVLGYAFVLRPMRRAERLAFFRQARRELREAKADVVRAAEETAALLRDTARRHTDAEIAKDGLVVVDARYGPDVAGAGLEVDVTVPVQALVNHSQLYIPGGRSKAGIQGFYAPVPPAVRTTLRVRYRFRGRPHYAEVPDLAPLVLPLEEHLVL